MAITHLCRSLANDYDSKSWVNVYLSVIIFLYLICIALCIFPVTTFSYLICVLLCISGTTFSYLIYVVSCINLVTSLSYLIFVSPYQVLVTTF